MDIIEARKVILKISSYLIEESSVLNEEQINQIGKIAGFIKSNILDNLGDLYEDNLLFRPQIMTELSKSFDKENIYKILRSNKLRKILTKEEILLLWNNLNSEEKKEYFNTASYIHTRDNFLVISEYITNNLNIEDLAWKLAKNSLEVEIKQKDDYSFEGLVTGEYLVKFINKVYFRLEDFQKIYKLEIIKIMPSDSLIIHGKRELVRKFLSNKTELIRVLQAKVLSTTYSTKELVNLYKELKYPNILDAIFWHDKDEYSKIIKNSFEYLNNNTINVNAYDLIKDQFSFTDNPLLYLKFSLAEEKRIIKEHASTDELINILRNKEFLNQASGEILENILELLPFANVYNFLQDNVIYEKVNLVSFNILASEKALIMSFLDSLKLIKKLKDKMFYKLLLFLDYDDLKTYIVKPYILEKMEDDEIVDLLSIKNIKLNNLEGELGKRFTKNMLISYINKMWEVDVDLSLISNKAVLQLIFDMDEAEFKKIVIDDVNYLFTTIQNKENLAMQQSSMSILSYKSVLLAYKALGISKTLDLLFNSKKNITMDEIKIRQQTYVKRYINKALLNDKNYLEELDFHLEYILSNYQEPLNNTEICKNKHLNFLSSQFAKLGIEFDEYLRVYNRFIAYKNINYTVAIEELRDFCEKVKETELKALSEQALKEFQTTIKPFVELKDSVYKEQIKNSNKKNLELIKYKLLYGFFYRNIDAKIFFRKNLIAEQVLDNFRHLISEANLTMIDYLEDILLPLSNDSFDVYKYLTGKGFKKPNNYEEYLLLLEQEANIKKLNRLLTKISYSKNEQELKVIVDYLLYDSYKKMSRKLKNECYKAKEIINSLNFEVYYDKNSNSLIASNLFNAYQDSDSHIYHENVKIIESVVKATRKLIKNCLVNSVIYKNYYNKFSDNNNDDNFDLNDYQVNLRIITINDLENLLAGLSIRDIETMDDVYIKYLMDNNILGWAFIHDGLGFDASKIFKNYKDFKNYLINNSLSLEALKVEDFLEIMANINNNLVTKVFELQNISYYEKIEIEDIIDAYKEILQHPKKIYSNINVSCDDWILNDISGMQILRTLIQQMIFRKNIINFKSLIKRASWENITILEVRNFANYMGIIIIETRGNKAIIDESLCTETIPKEVLNILAHELLKNKSIDIILTNNDNERYNNYNEQNMAIVEKDEYYCGEIMTYYGETTLFSSPVYELDKVLSNERLMNLVKLNFAFDKELGSFLWTINYKKVWHNYQKITFDLWNVAIYKDDEVIVHINVINDYFANLKTTA